MPRLHGWMMSMLVLAVEAGAAQAGNGRILMTWGDTCAPLVSDITPTAGPVSLMFSEIGKQWTSWYDPAVKPATKDGKQIVVSVSSDRNPGDLYLYERATGKARFLMRNRQWIDSKRMGTVKPIALTTRHGLKVHGLLPGEVFDLNSRSVRP